MGVERLADGLGYERVSASVSTAVVAGVAASRSSVASSFASAGGEPLLRFRRGAMNARRVHVDLVLLGGDRSIDVSFHPAAAVDVVRGQARRRSCDGNGWVGALLGAVLADARRWGAWTPASSLSSSLSPVTAPHAVLGGMAHPLVGRGYDAGVEPVPEIPRWASPVLAEDGLPAGAVRAFGARQATRTVVHAFGRFLLRPRVAWWQLAVAAALSDVVEPDELASVLAAEPTGGGGQPASVSVSASPSGSGSASVGGVLPSTEDVAVLRAGFRLLERGRARRLAVDAVTTDGESGARRLVTTLRSLLDVADDVRWPPPVRLVDLEAACLRASVVDPAPPPAALARPATAVARGPRDVRSPTAAPPVRAVSAGPVLPAWTVPRRPPTTGAAVAPVATAAFVHDERVVQAFDHRALAGGELELTLPRTPSELAAWGRLLGNCLADFAPAVAAHRSVIVGVRDRGTLVAALELRPDLRTVVQFLGVRNRVPPARITEPVLQRVVAGGEGASRGRTTSSSSTTRADAPPSSLHRPAATAPTLRHDADGRRPPPSAGTRAR